VCCASPTDAVASPLTAMGNGGCQPTVIRQSDMKIVMEDRFEDYSPEDIAEELEEYPFEPRYVM
jgi:hypothetical protein